MLDPRSTKSGFVTAVIAVSFLAGTAVATALIYLIWWLAGGAGWQEYSWPRDLTLRILWGCCILAVVATTLTRLTIVGWYFRRYFRADEQAVPPREAIGAGPRRPTVAPWFKSGALSFSMTLTLVSLAGVTAVASVVVWIMGDVFGDALSLMIFKILIGTFWFVCIVVVLTRIGVFRRHMLKGKRLPPPADAATPRPEPPDPTASEQPTPSSDKFTP